MRAAAWERTEPTRSFRTRLRRVVERLSTSRPGSGVIASEPTRSSMSSPNTHEAEEAR